MLAWFSSLIAVSLTAKACIMHHAMIAPFEWVAKARRCFKIVLLLRGWLVFMHSRPRICFPKAQQCYSQRRCHAPGLNIQTAVTQYVRRYHKDTLEYSSAWNVLWKGSFFHDEILYSLRLLKSLCSLFSNRTIANLCTFSRIRLFTCASYTPGCRVKANRRASNEEPLAYIT